MYSVHLSFTERAALWILQSRVLTGSICEPYYTCLWLLSSVLLRSVMLIMYCESLEMSLYYVIPLYKIFLRPVYAA